MLSRWFNIFVALFWLGSMVWLFQSQMLPSLLRGRPPDYVTAYPQNDQSSLVGWRMELDGRGAGWAYTSVRLTDNQTRIIEHAAKFEDLEVERLLPAWLRSLELVQGMGTRISLAAKTRMEVDRRRRLRGFTTEIGMDGLLSLLRLHGTRHGNYLDIRVSTEGFNQDHRLYFDDRSLMGDSLTPLAHLPGLREGQSWSLPVLNPFQAMDQPLDVLRAEVAREEIIIWNGAAIGTLVVVYRSARDTGQQDVRGRMWVRSDGTVVRQEASVFGSRLTFHRLSDVDVEQLQASGIGDGDD